MQTVQIVLDEALLAAVDEAARREKLNRSALVREALRHYLKRRRIEELEHRDRQGFERLPDEGGDVGFWEQAAAWPDD
jgi:metal-responsive CopG/Arc/MetJ family transcriptional regulator